MQRAGGLGPLLPPTKSNLKEPKMSPRNLSKALLMALGLGLSVGPNVSVAQPSWGQELVNRPTRHYGPSSYGPRYYGPSSNYDREVNGSDASTPGHN
jgi:hypothetical protein